MKRHMALKTCPVCNMTEINKALTYRFQGIEHYFCSHQCRQRFIEYPHLFVGDPKHGFSAKQKGEELIKSRKLNLSVQITDEIKSRLKQDVGLLMGVESLSFKEQVIFISYDLLQVSLEDIESAVVKSAGNLDGAITNKIKRGFIRYSEDCELDNLSHLTKKHGAH